MAPQNTPAKVTEDEQASQEVALVNDTALLAQFAEMAIMIPTEDGNGTEDILRQILAATTWDQLDQPWETSDVTDILGKRLHVTKVTRRPSTFSGGLGMFLVVHLMDAKTGATYVKTTGSIAIVGQFARAYALGISAMTIEWCRAERPTENGYYPQHIKVLDATGPTSGDGK